MNESNYSNLTSIDGRAFELMNAATDGELDPIEQAEWDRMLSESDQLRDLNEDYRSFLRLMNDVPERAPPEYLQEAIERQVRLPAANEEKSLLTRFAEFLNVKNWMRTGLALAAGLVVTVGVYEMGSGPMTPEDTAKLTGTVIEKPHSTQGDVLDSVHIYTDTLEGVVRLRGQEDMFSLDVSFKSAGLAQVVVNIADRGLEFEGMTNGQDFDNDVAINDGFIHVVSEGAQSYSLLLRQAPGAELAAPLELEFFANDTLVQAAALDISR